MGDKRIISKWWGRLSIVLKYYDDDDDDDEDDDGGGDGDDDDDNDDDNLFMDRSIRPLKSNFWAIWNNRKFKIDKKIM